MTTQNSCQTKQQSSFQIVGKMLVIGCFLVAIYYGFNSYKETEMIKAREQGVELYNNSEYDKALPFLKEAAEKGDKKAQELLATMKQKGLDVEPHSSQ